MDKINGGRDLTLLIKEDKQIAKIKKKLTDELEKKKACLEVMNEEVD